MKLTTKKIITASLVALGIGGAFVMADTSTNYAGIAIPSMLTTAYQESVANINSLADESKSSSSDSSKSSDSDSSKDDSTELKLKSASGESRLSPKSVSGELANDGTLTNFNNKLPSFDLNTGYVELPDSLPGSKKSNARNAKKNTKTNKKSSKETTDAAADKAKNATGAATTAAEVTGDSSSNGTSTSENAKKDLEEALATRWSNIKAIIDKAGSFGAVGYFYGPVDQSASSQTLGNIVTTPAYSKEQADSMDAQVGGTPYKTYVAFGNAIQALNNKAMNEQMSEASADVEAGLDAANDAFSSFTNVGFKILRQFNPLPLYMALFDNSYLTGSQYSGGSDNQILKYVKKDKNLYDLFYLIGSNSGVAYLSYAQLIGITMMTLGILWGVAMRLFGNRHALGENVRKFILGVFVMFIFVPMVGRYFNWGLNTMTDLTSNSTQSSDSRVVSDNLLFGDWQNIGFQLPSGFTLRIEEGLPVFTQDEIKELNMFIAKKLYGDSSEEQVAKRIRKELKTASNTKTLGFKEATRKNGTAWDTGNLSNIAKALASNEEIDAKHLNAGYISESHLQGTSSDGRNATITNDGSDPYASANYGLSPIAMYNLMQTSFDDNGLTVDNQTNIKKMASVVTNMSTSQFYEEDYAQNIFDGSLNKTTKMPALVRFYAMVILTWSMVGTLIAILVSGFGGLFKGGFKGIFGSPRGAGEALGAFTSLLVGIAGISIIGAIMMTMGDVIWTFFGSFTNVIGGESVWEGFFKSLTSSGIFKIPIIGSLLKGLLKTLASAILTIVAMFSLPKIMKLPLDTFKNFITGLPDRMGEWFQQLGNRFTGDFRAGGFFGGGGGGGGNNISNTVDTAIDSSRSQASQFTAGAANVVGGGLAFVGKAGEYMMDASSRDEIDDSDDIEENTDVAEANDVTTETTPEITQGVEEGDHENVVEGDSDEAVAISDVKDEQVIAPETNEEHAPVTNVDADKVSEYQETSQSEVGFDEDTSMAPTTAMVNEASMLANHEGVSLSNDHASVVNSEGAKVANVDKGSRALIDKHGHAVGAVKSDGSVVGSTGDSVGVLSESGQVMADGYPVGQMSNGQLTLGSGGKAESFALGGEAVTSADSGAIIGQIEGDDVAFNSLTADARVSDISADSVNSSLSNDLTGVGLDKLEGSGVTFNTMDVHDTSSSVSSDSSNASISKSSAGNLKEGRLKQGGQSLSESGKAFANERTPHSILEGSKIANSKVTGQNNSQNEPKATSVLTPSSGTSSGKSTDSKNSSARKNRSRRLNNLKRNVRADLAKSGVGQAFTKASSGISAVKQTNQAVKDGKMTRKEANQQLAGSAKATAKAATKKTLRATAKGLQAVGGNDPKATTLKGMSQMLNAVTNNQLNVRSGQPNQEQGRANAKLKMTANQRENQLQDEMMRRGDAEDPRR